jgi:hypothetical protein
MAYSEMSVLLGVLSLGTAWTLARGWSLLPVPEEIRLPFEINVSKIIEMYTR